MHPAIPDGGDARYDPGMNAIITHRIVPAMILLGLTTALAAAPAWAQRESQVPAIDQGTSSSAAERAAAGSATVAHPPPAHARAYQNLPRGTSSPTAARAARGSQTLP